MIPVAEHIGPGLFYCILIGDHCGYSLGHDEKGLPICSFDTQFKLFGPQPAMKCPNEQFMSEKARGIYEDRKYNEEKVLL